MFWYLIQFVIAILLFKTDESYAMLSKLLILFNWTTIPHSCHLICWVLFTGPTWELFYPFSSRVKFLECTFGLFSTGPTWELVHPLLSDKRDHRPHTPMTLMLSIRLPMLYNATAATESNANTAQSEGETILTT